MNINNLKTSAIMSYGTVLFEVLAGLVYTPWMLHSVGSVDYGLYILVTTFIAYFASDYGMWQALNKLILQYRVEGEEKTIQNLLGVTVKVYALLSIIIFLLLVGTYFSLDSIFSKLTTDELIKFKYLYLISVGFVLFLFPFNFLKGIFVSFELFFQARVFDIINRILLILVTISLLFFNFKLYSLVLAYGLVPILVTITKIIYLYKKGQRVNFGFWSGDMVKKLLGLSLWLFIVVLSELVISKLSPTLIAKFSGAQNITIFTIGFAIASYISSFANSINGLFLPKLSRMQNTKNYNAITNLTNQISRLQLFIIGYLMLGVWLTGKIFITAWVGNEFTNAYYVVSLLILPKIIFFAQQIEFNQLFLNNNIKYYSIMMTMSATTSVILSVLTIPRFGAIGAACSISLANLLFEVIGMNIIYHYVTKFNLNQFLKTFSQFLLFYCFIAVTYLLAKTLVLKKYTVATHLWDQFFIEGFVYSTIYVTLAFFILTKNEKTLTMSFIYKLFQLIKIRKQNEDNYV